MSQPAPPTSLIRFQQELEDAIRRELAAPAPPRRRAKVGLRLGAATMAMAAVIVAVIAFTSGAGPEVQSAAAMTIQRAAQALQPPPGSILHIDSTLTTEFSDGHSYSTRQDVWQQQNAVPKGAQAAVGCNYLNLQKSAPGTPAGTEGGTVNGREELYDPVRNTIYVAPPVKSAPVPPGVTLPNACTYMAGFAQHVRGVLTSGRARVDGHAIIDGKDTIKIVFATRVFHTRAPVPNTYYVAADGTYAPVKLVSGRRGDPTGLSTTLFHTYAEFAGSRHSRLLNLAARHPTARVDRTLAGYRSAVRRLFPNG